MKEGLQSVPFEFAEAECRRLREENARLRRLLAEHNIPIPPNQPANQPPLNPYCPRRTGKNEPERESHCFGNRQDFEPSTDLGALFDEYTKR